MTLARGRSRIAILTLAALALLFSFSLPRFALADAARARSFEPRPIDAPRLDRDNARVPPLPYEYVSAPEEAGVVFAYSPPARERVRQLIPRVAAIRSELAKDLGGEVLGSIEIRVAALPTEMARLSPIEPPSSVTAIAFSDAHLVVLSLASPISIDPPDLEELLRHELAHVALDEASGGHPLPRWLQEGFATEFAGENAAERAETLMRTELRDRPTAVADLDSRLGETPPSPVAYAEAAELTRFLTAGAKVERFHDLLRRVKDGETFEAALRGAYATDVADLDPVFRRDLAKRYSFVPVLAGATLLWAIVAAVVLARRARRRRLEGRLRRAARVELRGVRARVSRDQDRPRDRDRDHEDDAPLRRPTIVRPDPEVPKVEHDGRWYTLH